ncbi:halo transducer protein [Halobellus ordinarius]|uniref:halo transducer protein n=1 Tax=Halobellus ordinarius TaxID=3075120 RepID=UPI0028801BD9|nr:halo transducer protein [Halobellus sp. ZY16]
MSKEASVGVPVDDVIDAVDDCDPATTREALDPVTVDGAVTRDAIEAAVSDTSKLLATAETRVELVGNAYDDAVAAADPVSHLDIVRVRLDAFAERLSAVESRISELRPDLTVPADLSERPQSAYELAMELREVATDAQGIARTADDLSFDIDEFNSWLERPARRHQEFAEDVDLVRNSVEELAAVVEKLPGETADSAAQWADARMRAHVLSLLASDLRAELRDLRALAERDGTEVPVDLPTRLEQIETRTAEIEAELEARADRAWRDRFGSDLAAFEDALDPFEPPVDWGAVERIAAEHRPETAMASDAE